MRWWRHEPQSPVGVEAIAQGGSQACRTEPPLDGVGVSLER